MVSMTNEIMKSEVYDLPNSLDDLRFSISLSSIWVSYYDRRDETTTRCLGMASLSAVKRRRL